MVFEVLQDLFSSVIPVVQENGEVSALASTFQRRLDTPLTYFGSVMNMLGLRWNQLSHRLVVPGDDNRFARLCFGYGR